MIQLPLAGIVNVLQTLLGEVTLFKGTVFALIATMVGFNIYMEIVKLVKDLSVSPSESKYLAWAAARERREAWGERYRQEHGQTTAEDGVDGLVDLHGDDPSDDNFEENDYDDDQGDDPDDRSHDWF